MTGEEMERAIDFLVKSQANLEARIEQVNANLSARIEEVDQRLGARIEETNRQLAETNRQLAETNGQLTDMGKLLGEYTPMQTTLVQVVTRTFAAQNELNRRTDEKLNALIDTVNKMLSGGQGSNP
jgi:chromosome segregation ATPase